MSARSPRLLARAVAGGLLVVAIACLAAFRARWVTPHPEALGVLAAAAAIALLGVLSVAVATVIRGPRRVGPGAEALAAAGLVAVLSGGLLNWARSVQAAALLYEQEPIQLSNREDLAVLELGPAARRADVELTVALAKLELRAAGPDGFRPVSRLRVLDGAGEEVDLDVAAGRAAGYRDLVFRQGAFGFAPRLVVVQRGRTVLDGTVPFRTIRERGGDLRFLGELEIAEERLTLRGAVTLDALSDDMKGHPRLELAAERDGNALGGGTLAPGEYADVGDGYRVLFAGLKRWSEIDVSRRSYPVPILGGAIAFLLGAAVWPIAAWRRW